MLSVQSRSLSDRSDCISCLHKQNQTWMAFGSISRWNNSCPEDLDMCTARNFGQLLKKYFCDYVMMKLWKKIAKVEDYMPHWNAIMKFFEWLFKLYNRYGEIMPNPCVIARVLMKIITSSVHRVSVPLKAVSLSFCFCIHKDMTPHRCFL